MTDQSEGALIDLAQIVVQSLARHGLTVGFAESLTGGLLVDHLVAIPGSSGVVRGSLVTYATDTKISVLGLNPQLLTTHTVISPQVAAAMAQSALEILRCDLAIATTGVAGPSDQDGHGVGEVFLGFAQRQGLSLFAPQETLALDLAVLKTADPVHTRQKIRRATVKAALGVLAGRLDPEG